MKQNKESKSNPEESKSSENQKPETSEMPSAETVSIPKAEYETLLRKLKDLETSQERMLRSAADYENAKKRLAKEKEEYSKYALETFFYELLPVLDNFERALAHKNDHAAGKSVWSGIELTHKQLSEILKSKGLVRIDALKKPFDPHFHEAIAQVESETEPEGTVAEEIAAGYLLHGKVLRPSKVKVYSKQNSLDSEKIEEIT